MCQYVSDGEYLKFLESLEHPDSDEVVVPIETYLEELEAKEKESKGNSFLVKISYLSNKF